MNRQDFLSELYERLAKNRNCEEASHASYTRQLLKQGTTRIAQKVGEEAVETVIAAIKEDRKDIVDESADLLYHLLVLWLSLDIAPEDVYQELKQRATHKRRDQTRKGSAT